MQLLAVLSVLGYACAADFKSLILDDNSKYLRAVAILPQPTNGGHYGDPNSGCAPDEVAVHIQGVNGAICSPKCDSGCPSDVPSGCDALPQCILQDASSGNKYCALKCSKPTHCGDNASCKILFPGVGICTYDT